MSDLSKTTQRLCLDCGKPLPDPRAVICFGCYWRKVHEVMK